MRCLGRFDGGPGPRQQRPPDRSGQRQWSGKVVATGNVAPLPPEPVSESGLAVRGEPTPAPSPLGRVVKTLKKRRDGTYR